MGEEKKKTLAVEFLSFSGVYAAGSTDTK